MTAFYYFLHNLARITLEPKKKGKRTTKKRKKTTKFTGHCIYFVDDGGYSAWGGWSQCSVTCGNGRQSRSRSCTNPAPSPGGKDCSQLGPDKENKTCNDGGCPGNNYNNDEKNNKINRTDSFFVCNQESLICSILRVLIMFESGVYLWFCGMIG